MVTSLHVTRRNCTTKLTFMAKIGGFARNFRYFFMKSIFLTFIDHFTKYFGILMLYLFKTRVSVQESSLKYVRNFDIIYASILATGTNHIAYTITYRSNIMNKCVSSLH